MLRITLHSGLRDLELVLKPLNAESPTLNSWRFDRQYTQPLPSRSVRRQVLDRSAEQPQRRRTCHSQSEHGPLSRATWVIRKCLDVSYQ